MGASCTNLFNLHQFINGYIDDEALSHLSYRRQWSTLGVEYPRLWQDWFEGDYTPFSAIHSQKVWKGVAGVFLEVGWSY